MKIKRYKLINGEPVWIVVIRLFLGMVFVFSSVVKGIDPVGTAYRVEDYLLVFGWSGLVRYAIVIAFLVIISEFILGIAFLFKLRMKIAVFAMFFIMVFFTVVTYFDAVNNWVPDCGCFGDAVKLSNWQTFFKNIFLISLNIIALIKYKTWRFNGKPIVQWMVIFIIGGLFAGFVTYNYRHLPIVDFRAWKVGRSMKTTGENNEKVYVTYKNKTTGEIKEYQSPNYPWKDSTWLAQWEFVNQRIDDSQVDKKYNLVIEDSLGNDFTKDIIENRDKQFIVISYYLSAASNEGMKKLSRIIPEIKKYGVSVVLLTASDNAEIKKVLKQYHLNIPAYFADDVELKAMIRSNPGLMLMQNAIVLKKWHYNDFPNKKNIDKQLNNNSMAN